MIYHHCDEEILYYKKQWDQDREKELISMKIQLLKLQNNQPERSKREDLNCDNCKIPHIFNCCWDQPKYKHKNNKECEYYKFRMRCSEHCGNTVREAQ